MILINMKTIACRDNLGVSEDCDLQNVMKIFGYFFL